MRRWALAIAVVLGWVGVDALLSDAWAQAQFAVGSRWDLADMVPGPDDLVLAVLALLAVGVVTWRRRKAPEL